MSVRRKGRDMSLENTKNIELPKDDEAAAPEDAVSAEPAAPTPPREPPRKRYAAPSAPRVMGFMRPPGEKA